MKSIAILLIGVLLGAGMMLFVPQVGPPHVVYAGSPSGNGDVNGDAKINIADAVYLLAYLFAQGPAPEAIKCAACDSCCPPARLPATGQTLCFSTEQMIPCDDPDWPGQDGFYHVGCPMAERYLDGGDGTVTDTCTGMMWQKETAPAHYTWQQALQYSESLELAGHTDWRLPNVRELQSIVDYGRVSPSIDPVFEAEPLWYWSSSTYVSSPTAAWSVHFYGGSVSGDIRTNAFHVRAVRG